MSHKLIYRFLIAPKLLLVASCLQAQVDSVNVITGPVPFVRGNWEVRTQKYAWGYNFNEKDGDLDLGSSSRYSFNLETHYAWSPKFMTGFEFNYDSRTTKNGSEIKSNDFSVLGHLSYTINMKKGWGIYLRGGAGVGSGKTEVTQGTNTQEAKSDIFIYKFELGTPIYLNEQLYFLPNISYKNTSADFDDGEENESRIRVGLGLVSYLNCGDDRFDDTSPQVWARRYARGVSYLGVHGMGDYSFGNSESIFGSQTLEDDINRFNLKFDYVYYVFPNVGIGADVGFRSMVTKSSDIDLKTVRSSYSVGPKFVYNFGTNNWFNDFFAFAGGGFGSEKNEFTISGNTNTQKDNLSYWLGGIGANYFVSKSSLFTFSVAYENRTLKNDDNDQKITESGVRYELGFRTALNLQPKFRF